MTHEKRDARGLLSHLEDSIFGSLPYELAIKWPERFLDTISVGKDLSVVWPKFALWLLVDPEWGVLQFAKTEESRNVIQTVANLFERVIKGEGVSLDEWYDAAADADTDDAAVVAAVAAAFAAFASTSANANAASTSANYAAYSAAVYVSYATDAAACLKYRTAQCEKLLELLEENYEKQN